MTWRDVQLGDVVEFFDYERIPLSTLEREKRQGEYRYYGAQGVIDYIDEYIFDGEYVLVAEDGANLVTRNQPIAFLVGGKFWVNNHAHILKGKSGLTTNYYIKSLLNNISISGYVTGAAQPKLNQKNLKSVRVRLPSYSVQNKIASILSAYDDFIENNNRRIALLEESARLLYREWFVRLRFPGYENTRITDGVPEGWGIVQLKDYIKVIHGCAFKGAYFSDTETPLILLTPGNFKVGGGIKFDKLKFYSEAGPLDERYVLSKEDLLVTMTDLSKMSDTLGYPMLVPDHSKYTFLHNQRLGKVEPTSTFFPRYFLYCLFQDYRYRNHVVGSASGVAVKHTSPTKVLSFKVPLPKMRRGGIVDDFNNITQYNFLQIEMLMRMNHSLQKARDLLLPKLINGEIPV